MKKFNFWHTWLRSASVLVIILGLSITFFNQTLVFKILFNNPINDAFWHSEILPNNYLEFQKWIYGVLGAVMIGWGIILFFVISKPFKDLQKWAWDCLVVGISAWYVVDTFISFYYNVFLNVVFNTFLLVLFCFPLIFLRRHFK